MGRNPSIHPSIPIMNTNDTNHRVSRSLCDRCVHLPSAVNRRVADVSVAKTSAASTTAPSSAPSSLLAQQSSDEFFSSFLGDSPALSASVSASSASTASSASPLSSASPSSVSAAVPPSPHSPEDDDEFFDPVSDFGAFVSTTDARLIFRFPRRFVDEPAKRGCRSNRPFARSTSRAMRLVPCA